jgi:cell fate regulator YaaT (PSP1 superfamily)
MRKSVNVKIGDAEPSERFDTTMDLKIGDRVIVETATGSDWGVVSSTPAEARGNSARNQVLRVADAADNKTIDKLVTSAKYALKVANDRIAKYKLAMKPLSVAYTFDSSKIIIQYYADSRVDFRELVKDLASSLRTRIELRQVGARDEARIIGGIGTCGMECCCKRFLKNFDNVTIKMAKTQNIALNPAKINGMCGRLLCCLAHENDYYAEMQDKMPRYGSEVQTPDGRGIAQDNNMLKETVNVKFQDGDTNRFQCYKLCDLKCKHCGRADS